MIYNLFHTTLIQCNQLKIIKKELQLLMCTNGTKKIKIIGSIVSGNNIKSKKLDGDYNDTYLLIIQDQKKYISFSKMFINFKIYITEKSIKIDSIPFKDEIKHFLCDWIYNPGYLEDLDLDPYLKTIEEREDSVLFLIHKKNETEIRIIFFIANEKINYIQIIYGKTNLKIYINK